MTATIAVRPSLFRWAPLTVFGLATSVTWALFLGGGMRSVCAWLVLMALLPAAAALLVLATAIVAVVKRRFDRVVLATVLVGGFALWPAAWNFQRLTIRYPFRLATATPSATVRLPLDGAVRVGWGGDDLAHNYHAQMPDQRWAYDLLVEPAAIGSARLQDYGCYGKPVVAPVAGEVWVAHDGEPEQVPGTLVPNYRAPLGNHVVIRLADGTFILLAHLQTGSIAVHRGARLAESELIGRCGNSGNTSEPHVHIHHQRQDPRVYPTGFAEGLPLYFRDHDGAPMPRGGMCADGDKPVLTGDVVRHTGARPPLQTASK